MFQKMMILCALVLLFQPCLVADEKVLIAAASDGEILNSAVSRLAARSPYLLIIDSKGKLVEVIENPYKESRGSAGVSVAALLAEKNVTIVIAGNFGSKMKDALEAREITSLEFEGSVKDGINKVLKKEG